MTIYIILYILLLYSAIADFSKKKQRNVILLIWSVILVLFIGFRGTTGTDTGTYISFFNYYTNTISDWKAIDKQYAEYGFYFLSVILKSIIDNTNFYFLTISILTFSFLIPSLLKMSIYPIMGLIVYFSRFMLIRDMNQIRQALAIVIIIFALKYLGKNKNKIFIWLLLLATCFHYSSIIILPFIFLYKINLTTKKAALLFILSCAISIILGETIKLVLTATDNIVLLTYANTENLGLTNPVIIFQTGLFFLFSYYGKLLNNIQPYYETIRNAYFYSLILLVLTSGLGEIGGRLATIFATCEIFIIPALVKIIKPYYLGYIVFILLSIFLFYMNFNKLDPYFWNYFDF